MDKKPSVETQDVVCQRFVWKDGEHSCGAGDLLCVITVLEDSKKENNFIDAPECTDYLKSKGLIEETSEHHFKAASGKMEELVELGNTVSGAIGDEIEKLPVNTSIKLGPSILAMPVPNPLFRR